MPGYKVFLEDGEEIREGLTCSYCKLVLKDPVQTSESGLRLCRECFEEAKKDPKYVGKLDSNDKIQADVAVKREITHLRVKCENYNVECDWRGLFKQLMQHSQECQYVTGECSNAGCGQRVLLARMEAHLKKECLQREVKCEYCGKKMHFVNLEDHIEMCPNSPTKCKFCDKRVPVHEFIDHLIECKRIGCEFTKMLEAVLEVFKEVAKVNYYALKRIDVLESCHQEDAQRIKTLEDHHQVNAQKIKTLEIQALQNESKIQALKKSNRRYAINPLIL